MQIKYIWMCVVLCQNKIGMCEINSGKTKQDRKIGYFFFGKLRPSPPAMRVSLICSWFFPVFLFMPAAAREDDGAVDIFRLDPDVVPMVTWLILLLDSLWTVVVLLWWWLLVVAEFVLVGMDGPRLLSLESSFVTESDSLLRSAELKSNIIETG